jgi:DNA-binding SARP family transcriptional activator
MASHRAETGDSVAETTLRLESSATHEALQEPSSAPARRASILTVRLLGHFDVRLQSGVRCDLGSHKAEELFAFLVLRRGKPCGRDYVADLLWEDGCAQSRKYLRQALWQVNRGLAVAGLEDLLCADHEWLRLRHEGLSVDLLVVEDANQRNLGQVGHELAAESAAAIESAALLYEGDLMDGWPANWLADERERCRAVFLALAEKLCDFHESQGHVDATLAWSERILAADPAHERTYQRSMRVLYVAGDRTGALRQFQRCTTALSRELDVTPSPETVALMQQIRAGAQRQVEAGANAGPTQAPETLAAARLRGYADRLRSLVKDLDQDIAVLFQRQDGRRRSKDD